MMTRIMKGNRTLHAGGPAGAPGRCQMAPSNRILVVDDEPILRLFSTQVLCHSGYQVDAAEDGAAAWDTLQVNRYQLLITDHNMPKVSGVELLKKLRAAHMDLPVILMSGAMPTEELDRNPWLQPAAKLLKPFASNQLLGAVEKVLREAWNAHEEIGPEIIPRSHSSVAHPSNDFNSRHRIQ